MTHPRHPRLNPNAITNWFDIKNLDHLRAWNNLQDTGFWPGGFIPEGTFFPTLWQHTISGRMAEEYVKCELADDYTRSIP